MTVSTNNTYNNAPTTASVAGGTIDNAPIGSTTPSTGAFTTLSATGQSTITTVLSGATANFTDFPRAQVVVSTANTGVTDPGIHALVCESKSDGTYNAHGLDGCAATNGTGAGIGISGTGRVTATGDTGGAFGVYSSADATHAGGANYGVYSSATNGATNYSFYGAAGTLYNAGGVNTTPIGNVTPSTGAFTTLSASSGITSIGSTGTIRVNSVSAGTAQLLDTWINTGGSGIVGVNGATPALAAGSTAYSMTIGSNAQDLELVANNNVVARVSSGGLTVAGTVSPTTAVVSPLIYSVAVTKTIAAGATVDLVSIGSYSAELSGVIHIRATPPASGRLTSRRYSIDMMGSGSNSIDVLSTSIYSTGSAFTLAGVVNSPSAGYNKLTLTNNDSVSVDYLIKYQWIFNSGAVYY